MFQLSKIVMTCILVLLTSCVSRQYYPEVNFSLPPKEKKTIEFLTQKPRREAIRIGLITLNGSAYALQRQLVFQAKNRAAAMGGDFIMAESMTGSSLFGSSSVQANDCPWGNFSIWAYTPSQTGLKLDHSTIVGFHLKSDAPEANVHIGDTLLGIDGYDLNDECLVEHMMSILPGDKIKLSLLHKSKRVERKVTALPN